MESENPDDHQRVEAADVKRKKTREAKKKYRTKMKKKQESKEGQLQNLENECRRFKAQVKFNEKQSMMKALLGDACKSRKLVLEPGESSGHARDAVEKETGLVNSLSRELLKTPLPGGGTCGGTSASIDKDAYPPLELSAAAMKPDGSVTTESFKPCQLLPEQWTQPPLPGGGTCGGTSASTDKDAYPPLELSAAAMKPDGSVTTESFKPCQLLPEQWTQPKHSTCRKECRGSTSYSTEMLEGVPNPMESAMSLNGSVMSGSFKPCESLPDADKLAFNKLSELYIASEAQHAQEKVTLLKLHAQEMAAAAAQHAQEKVTLLKLHAQEMAAAAAQHKQEMVAAAERHAQEMDEVKIEYSLKYLENMGQPLAEDYSNFDINQFLR